MSVRSFASIGLGFVLIAVLLAPSAYAGAEPPEPAFGPQQMWASILPPAGWGFTANSITNPGPPITVAPGELVQLRLLSLDTIPHQWVLDLDNSQDVSAGDLTSAVFSSDSVPTNFDFNAPMAPGTYTYFCGIHGWSAQNGAFTIGGGGNQPPTITLINPDGTTQNRWTGGSSQRLSWTMSDPDGTPDQLAVWLNYSYNGGASTGVIAGPPGLPLGSTFYNWNVPLVDATDMTVRAEVADPQGAKGTDSRQVPVVDSTRPSINGVTPTPGATGVSPATWLNITFSEAMNQPSALGATSLCVLPGCATFVPLSVVGWTANTLTVRPTNPLAADTQYRATVSTTARDSSNPGNALASPFVWDFQTSNNPPSVAVAQPTTASRWTGGSVHAIQWTVTDPEDPPSATTAWVNYSAIGAAPWTPVVGPVPGTTTSFMWSVPLDDTATARLEFTAVDSSNAKTVVAGPVFVIDSTAPSVQSTNPANGAIDVPVTANVFVTFSEPMNKGVVGARAVVGLQEVPTSAWIPVTYSWDGPGVQLTVNPTPTLQSGTDYRLFVNATAVDASDPGNAMGTDVMRTFTTGVVADLTPPTIANMAATPATQSQGGTVEISADVTDDMAMGSVSVNVTLPDATTRNETMVPGAGDRWSFSDAWTQVGTHPFVIWASDASDNWASASGSFAITMPQDTTPPEIAHTSPSGPFHTVDTIVIEATVTDDVAVQEVRIDWTDVAGTRRNVTMTPSGGVHRFTIPAQTAAGTVSYKIYAVDPSGNENVTRTYLLSIQLFEGPPSEGIDAGLVAALVLLVVAALLALVFLMRRRKGKGPEETPPPGGP